MDPHIRGLQILKKRVPVQAQNDFETLEARLMDNLHSKRLYGETEATRSDRAQIVRALNELAQQYCDQSFNEMCYTPEITPVRLGATPHKSMQQEENYVLDQVALPEVSYGLLTNVVPTAYCQQLDVHDFPLIEFLIDNTGAQCENASINLRASIEVYSNEAATSIHVAKGQKKRISLLPLLNPDIVKGMNERRSATLHIFIDFIAPRSRSEHYTERIKLHSRNTALLAQEDHDETLIDLTRYLAAWVTPRHALIERLLRKVVEYHPSRSLDGYQLAPTLTEMAAIVREQARAIFQALKQDAHLVYINSSLDLSPENKQVVQHVRLPAETLSLGGNANCLDGAVLFASLLLAINIEPLIVLIGHHALVGHAFVGWRAIKQTKEYEFLDTTRISDADFDTAQHSAQEMYDYACTHGYFERSFADPDGFASLIDVVAQQRTRIDPLPWSNAE